MAKNHIGEDPITVNVHGLRNQVAVFQGGAVQLLVGAMAPSARITEPAVLLTLDGRDPKGNIVDIEISIPRSQVDALVARILDRAKIHAPISITARGPG